METTFAALAPPEGECVWPAGLPDLDLPNGLSIRVLTSADELVHEGRRGQGDDGMDGLAHCVGGYHRECRSGESRIVSLHRKCALGRPTRVSTAQISTSVDRHGKRKFSVLQHRGYENSTPSLEAVEALDSYMGRLVSGELHHDHGGFPHLLSLDPSDSVGYDAGDPECWATAMATWRRFLPPGMATWTPRTLAEHAVRSSAPYLVAYPKSRFRRDQMENLWLGHP
jgi:hypothetical protein